MLSTLVELNLGESALAILLLVAFPPEQAPEDVVSAFRFVLDLLIVLEGWPSSRNAGQTLRFLFLHI